jgi:hypothetical protein
MACSFFPFGLEALPDHLMDDKVFAFALFEA